MWCAVRERSTQSIYDASETLSTDFMFDRMYHEKRQFCLTRFNLFKGQISNLISKLIPQVDENIFAQADSSGNSDPDMHDLPDSLDFPDQFNSIIGS